MKKLMMAVLCGSLAVAMVGCRTATRKYAHGETRSVVAGFSEEDIQDTISRAVQSICKQDRIKLLEGADRAATIVEDIIIDTNERGNSVYALAEALGQSLREELTNSGKVLVYNKEAAQYATVKVAPQYRLVSHLTERNLRQDDDDYQKEYNLNLTLVDLATGLEFWQKRVHVGKLVDRTRVNY